MPDPTEPAQPSEPIRSAWLWEARIEGVEMRFFGRARGPEAIDPEALLDSSSTAVARLVQIHSDRVHEATLGGVGAGGVAGEGDALVTSERDLALAVATADCLPVLLAAPGWIAAVHAGWRGLVARVIDRTLDRVAEPSEVEAWIGPAIGPCCYEVSDEVAAEVAAASADDIVVPRRGARPHIDLRLAAARQLRERGVSTVGHVDRCTRCNPDKLWSYRRDGSGAQRNWAMIWRPSRRPET